MILLPTFILILFLSLRFGNDDLHWPGVGRLLRDSLLLVLSRDLAWREPLAADDFHVHADVLYLHECPGKRIGSDRTPSIHPSINQ